MRRFARFVGLDFFRRRQRLRAKTEIMKMVPYGYPALATKDEAARWGIRWEASPEYAMIRDAVRKEAVKTADALSRLIITVIVLLALVLIGTAGHLVFRMP